HWVNLGHSAPFAECPVYPRQRTLRGHRGRSESCQNRTHAVQQTNARYGGSYYSALMLVRPAHLAHFSVSSAISFPNAGGEGQGRCRAGGQNPYRASAARHQFTRDFLSLSCFTPQTVPSLKSLRGAPDQYAVLQVTVLQLPPAVIHSPVRSTSQAQMAFFGLAGSTVHGLLRHHVQGVPAAHFSVRLPCANCLSANWEYTVRMPLASVLVLTVSHATVAKFGPSST